MAACYHHFTTTQTGPAPRLAEIVQRHARIGYQKPIAAHQVQALELIRNFIGHTLKPIIIDSGCGTGLSTIKLAGLYPDHWVIGIDKSQARLSRVVPAPHTNYLLLRADVIDMWRLLSKEGWPITHHFIFFPNPWPKAAQLKRRFHAHPVFATMAALAPQLELRTNWRIYAEECALALGSLGHAVTIAPKSDLDYMTLFEKKYLESACPIFILKSRAPEIPKGA